MQSAFHRHLLLVSAVAALTGCEFDGEFIYNDRDDAGQASPSDAGRSDAGQPESGTGGAGRGGTGGAIAGQGGAGAGEPAGGTGGEPEQGGAGAQSGAGGDTSLGGQGGETQGGSQSEPPVAGQGDDDDPPVAGSGDEDPPVAGSGDDDDPPVAGSGDDDPPVAGGGGDDDPPIAGQSGEPQGGQGGAGQGGSGGEPPQGGQGGAGGEPQGGAGAGGEPSTEPLHDLEVVSFTIDNGGKSPTPEFGDIVLGSVTYLNPNTKPYPVNQIVIAGRPPGGTNAGGPYLDMIPTLGGPTTVGAGETLTYSASRTLMPSDPAGVWRFYPTYQDLDNVWHDGESISIEVVSIPRVCEACSVGETCCGEQCVDLMQDKNNCGACGNVCPYANSLCCNGTCADALSNTSCGECGRDCSLLGDGSLTCSCTQDTAGAIKCEGPVLGLCL